MDYNFIEDYDENLVIMEPNPVYPDDDYYAPSERTVCQSLE